MSENIEKALHDIFFVCEDLRAANKKASALESMILIDLIQKAEDLKNKISQFNSAAKDS